ncbi:MAG TPA: ABC transporter permease [Candidatus Limnocylindrales bacterium]|nr:ABC transporter permease [Candidatus Limnocylindrales bacterium]
MTAQADVASTAASEAATDDGPRRITRLWPFVPAALVLALLFLAPLVIAFAASFWQTGKNLQLLPEWTLKNYAYVLGQGPYLAVFVKTILVAVLVTALGVGTALPFAYFLVRYLTARWQRILLLAVVVPFWTSYLVRIYAWQAILGESGILNQFLIAVGAITEPLDVFLYNDVGVAIVLWYLYFPFAVLAIYTALERFDFTQLTAAQDLGASSLTAFRRILLPQVRPGIITACIFVFIPILGEYLTPTLVGGTKGILIGYDIVTFYQGGSYPLMAATAFLVASVVLVLLIVFRRYLQVEDLVRGAG